MAKTEETWMDGITTEMMEHICDNLCRYPDQLSEWNWKINAQSARWDGLCAIF